MASVYHNVAKILLLFAVQVESVYFVRESSSKWDPTNPPCQLATPNIVMITADYRIIVEVPNYLHKEENDYLRVGYILELGVFDYIGCTNAVFMNISEKINDMPLDPGMCHSFCKTDYFGVSAEWHLGRTTDIPLARRLPHMNIRNKPEAWIKFTATRECYCLNNKPGLDNELKCNVSCQNPAGALCGQDNFTSIYKYVLSDNNEAVNESHCRFFNGTSKSFHWRKCSYLYSGLCANETMVLPIQGSVNWSNYPALCFQTQMYPITEDAIMPDNFEETHMWTGRIRGWVITEIKGYPTNSSEKLVPGYIYRNGTTYQFGFANKDTIKKAFCYTANVSAMNPSTEIAQRAVIAAYVGGPVVLVIVVAVMSCFLKKKRVKQTYEDIQQLRTVPVQYQDAGLSVRGNSGYAECYPDNTSGYCYTNGIAFATPQGCVSVGVNNGNTFDEGEYDTTGVINVENIEARVDDRVYNQLDDSFNDIYDHTSKGGRIVNRFPDHVYDRIENYMKSNTTNAVDDTFDNTYDRAGGPEGATVKMTHRRILYDIYEHIKVPTEPNECDTCNDAGSDI